MKMLGAEGSGRRLPQWMLGVSASDQVDKSDNIKAKKKPVEGLSSQASIPDPKAKKKLLSEEQNLSERPDVLAKCTAKRKQKAKLVDADFDDDGSFDVPEKKYKRTLRKVSESASRKRRKRKNYKSSDEELDTKPVSEDEDVELTVEDLMTIAKEYVGEDNNMDLDQASKRECERRRKSSSTTSIRKESIHHNDARIGDHATTVHDISASYNETKAAHDVSVLKNSESSSTQVNDINTTRTGDPAQDMLDLFLGPLLKKPANDKKDTLIGDIDFSQHLRTQSKTNTVKEEIAPPIKKKSSLKDKVAMFLD